MSTIQKMNTAPFLCNPGSEPLCIAGLSSRLKSARGQRGLTLVRYADDFVVLAEHKAMIQTARVWAAANLKRLGLEIHPEKTAVKHFDQGFQFVGWFFVRDEMFQIK